MTQLGSKQRLSVEVGLLVQVACAGRKVKERGCEENGDSGTRVQERSSSCPQRMRRLIDG